MLWPGCSIWNRDFDRTVSDSTLRAISEVTGVSVEVLATMTLRDMVVRSGYHERIEGRQAGILPVGVYHRVRRAYGQQYCIRCLSLPSPYLKREWRSELVVACRVHGILLSDGCPRCDAPFVPHRNHSLIRTRCYRCRGSLVDASDIAVSDQVMRLQSSIAWLLGVPDDSITAESVRLIRSFAQTDADVIDGLRRLCRLHASRRSRKVGGGRAIEWSSRRTDQRAVVLEQVAHSLSNWPLNWIAWAGDQRLTQNDLEKRLGPWPPWIRSAMVHIPFSHAATGFHSKRDIAPLRTLRRRAPTLLAYRHARARLLLREALNVSQALE